MGKEKINQSDNLFLSLHCNIWKIISVDIKEAKHGEN
jgi:hypothetical protein